MKTIQKISALLVASASLSMAGVIDVYTDGGKKPSTSLNLTTIDSLTFSGKGEKKEMDFSGKAKQKGIKLSDIDRMEFTLKDKSKETMTVKVGEGVTAGKHTFKLSEIKKIEIVEMDAKEDADGDGLTDLDEIYKYDTNPKSADTDGDGWSDSDELADGMYSPSNPTKFNPRIADVPGLRVTLKKSPSISLNITTLKGESKSETISEGKDVSKTSSTSYEQTRSTDIMDAWDVSTTQGWEIGKENKEWVAKWVGNVTVGYNGSFTSSTGMTWNSSEEKSVTESYEKAIAKEKSEGSEVNGATVCMQVELKNTSDIAFTIEGLKLSASIYDIKDTATLKILADLSREGDWSDITLKPTESVQAKYCNNDVKVELIEDLIYNTSSIVLGSSTQKITFDGGNSDFTKVYTNVAAKTADITIDYGPGADGNSSVRYQVATNYRYNIDHKGTDDMYAKTTLAELLRNAHVEFKQDSIEGPSKKKLYGLASIDGYEFNLKDSAMWFISIQRAADIKKGLNTMDLYAFAVGSYDMEKIFVSAGDAVHIFYSKDEDHDGVPLSTEHLFGTSDKKVDSDGDGLSDYDEITGWTKDKSKTKIYTDPANKDTDGDGLNDKEDPEPTKRPMFTDATLSMLQVFADSVMADSTALLSLDSAALDSVDTMKVFVQAAYAFFKVIPNAKKVTWVRIKSGEAVAYAQSTEEDGKTVYTLKTPEPLTVLENTEARIEIKSEDENTVMTYSLSISSKLNAPTNLKLGKSANRDAIHVIFDRPKDSRVKGYVILRSADKNLPDSIENKAKISNGSSYKQLDVIMMDDTAGMYRDAVGGGSDYYRYRVFAYTTEGDTANPLMVFSKGTEQKQRNVGRLHLQIRLFDYGGEYHYYGGHREDIWSDINLFNTSCGGRDPISYWYGYDYMAGLSKHGETVIFLSEEFDDEDKKPANDTRHYSIGKEGMCLEIRVQSDVTGADFTQKIYWKYDKMVSNNQIVYGNGENDNAPKKGENRFLVGKDGIKYNDTNGWCIDNDKDYCGGDIHAGYKFWIEYSWDNDNDFY